MSRSAVNFIVDAAALAAILLLASTGILIHVVLPPGSGHFNTLWGMDRHEWGEIHFWIALFLLLAMALHLFLHWRWIVSMIQGRSRAGSTARAALAIAVTAAVVVFAVAPFFGRVENKSGMEEGPHAPRHRLHDVEPSETPEPRARADEHVEDSTYKIEGSMTLIEVERSTGVAAAIILKELGLPSDTPTDERLGRLRKTHGFEIHDVREAVQKYAKPGTPKDHAP